MTPSSALSRSLPAFADDLKAENDKAARLQLDHDYENLTAMLKRHGAANLVALLAQLFEETAMEQPEVEDWRDATKAMEVAAKAVDLPYAEPEEDPTPAAVQDAQDRIIRRRARPSDYDLALG